MKSIVLLLAQSHKDNKQSYYCQNVLKVGKLTSSFIIKVILIVPGIRLVYGSLQQ